MVELSKDQFLLPGKVSQKMLPLPKPPFSRDAQPMVLLPKVNMQEEVDQLLQISLPTTDIEMMTE